MTNLFNTLDNGALADSEVCLHERNGRWYACNQSYEKLNRQNQAAFLYRRVCQPWDILEEVEVDLNYFFSPRWGVALCADDGLMFFPRF
jgi:hypothetical protein